MTGTENFCFRIGSGVGLWCDGPAAAGFRKGENIMELGEGLKKILLVGIGTAAVTAEKSKEILDELVNVSCGSSPMPIHCLRMSPF